MFTAQAGWQLWSVKSSPSLVSLLAFFGIVFVFRCQHEPQRRPGAIAMSFRAVFC